MGSGGAAEHLRLLHLGGGAAEALSGFEGGRLVAHIAGLPMTGSFDGHENCFIESGDDKALLIDFNYETEPLAGKYPLPVIGPMDLLRGPGPTTSGKQAFRWVYWNVLLPGRPVPLPAHMSMVGKTVPGLTDKRGA